MTIKLSRDQARFVQQYFFPYMERLLETKVLQSEKDQEENLLAKLMRSIFICVQLKFARKLSGFSKKFAFDLQDHEGIIIYRLLMAFPIQADQIYMQHLRQYITDTIHAQLAKPETVGTISI
jgi:hypothetical protein